MSRLWVRFMGLHLPKHRKGAPAGATRGQKQPRLHSSFHGGTVWWPPAAPGQIKMLGVDIQNSKERQRSQQNLSSRTRQRKQHANRLRGSGRNRQRRALLHSHCLADPATEGQHGNTRLALPAWLNLRATPFSPGFAVVTIDHLVVGKLVRVRRETVPREDLGRADEEHGAFHTADVLFGNLYELLVSPPVLKQENS